VVRIMRVIDQTDISKIITGYCKITTGFPAPHRLLPDHPRLLQVRSRVRLQSLPAGRHHARHWRDDRRLARVGLRLRRRRQVQPIRHARRRCPRTDLGVISEGDTFCALQACAEGF
jgi:hypothetical protein